MKTAIALLCFAILTPGISAASIPCDDAAAKNRIVDDLKKSCTDGTYCNADGHVGTTPAVAMERCTGAGQKYGTCASKLKCEGKVSYCNERGYSGPGTVAAAAECVASGKE